MAWGDRVRTTSPVIHVSVLCDRTSSVTTASWSILGTVPSYGHKRLVTIWDDAEGHHTGCCLTPASFCLKSMKRGARWTEGGSLSHPWLPGCSDCLRDDHSVSQEMSPRDTLAVFSLLLPPTWNPRTPSRCSNYSAHRCLRHGEALGSRLPGLILCMPVLHS